MNAAHRRRERGGARTTRSVAAALLLAAAQASAADFNTIAEAAVLYDAPSSRAKPLFVLGRDTPVEVIVPLEGWSKVRDPGGTIGWVDRKHLSDRRTLVVRVTIADVRASPEEASPLVFRAEQNVLLDLAEAASAATATANPGWVKVRHRDGQSGYVRVAHVFGL
jgi:SH3-like domain-containing protein